MTLSYHKNLPQSRQLDAKFATADMHGEPTKEEILQNIRTSMRQALDGETRPASEALDEIRHKIAADADTG